MTWRKYCHRNLELFTAGRFLFTDYCIYFEVSCVKLNNYLVFFAWVQDGREKRHPKLQAWVDWLIRFLYCIIMKTIFLWCRLLYKLGYWNHSGGWRIHHPRNSMYCWMHFLGANSGGQIRTCRPWWTTTAASVVRRHSSWALISTPVATNRRWCILMHGLVCLRGKHGQSEPGKQRL